MSQMMSKISGILSFFRPDQTTALSAHPPIFGDMRTIGTDCSNIVRWFADIPPPNPTHGNKLKFMPFDREIENF